MFVTKTNFGKSSKEKKKVFHAFVGNGNVILIQTKISIVRSLWYDVDFRQHHPHRILKMI